MAGMEADWKVGAAAMELSLIHICFGSDLVITDGFEGTAIGGVDEQQNDGDADAGEEEGHHGFQMQSYTAQ